MQSTTYMQTGIKTRKRILMTAILSLLFIGVLFMHITVGIASSMDEAAANASNDEYEYIGTFFDEAYQSKDLFDSVLKIASVDWIYSVFTGTDESQLISNVSASMDKVAVGLGGLFALVIATVTVYSILKEASKGNLSLEMWSSIAIKALLGLAVAALTIPVINGIEAFGIELLKILRDAFTNENLATMAGRSVTVEEMTSASQGATTGISIFLSFYIKFMVYKILIELFLRKVLAPLGAVWIITDGLRGPGIRFFKKYLGVYMQIIILILCFAMGQYLFREFNLVNNSLDSKETINSLILFSSCANFAQNGGALAKEVLDIS